MKKKNQLNKKDKDNDKNIVSIIAKVLKVDSKKLKKSLRVGDIPEWDSLAQIQIYFELSKIFKKEINMKNLSLVRSISDWTNIYK